MSEQAKAVQQDAVGKLVIGVMLWHDGKMKDEELRVLSTFVRSIFPDGFFDQPATKTEKVAHVKAAKQTRGHTCHWTGCEKQVPPAMWGCKTHWFRLPKSLRDRIWATYRPGQEATMTPSDEYLDAAKAVQMWIAESGGAP